MLDSESGPADRDAAPKPMIECVPTADCTAVTCMVKPPQDGPDA